MSLKKAFTFYIFADFFNVWLNWEATYAEVLLQWVCVMFAVVNVWRK